MCTAPIALSTAFTGVLFYDGASTAVMQVTRDNPTMRTCAALHGDDARVQAKIQSCVIPTWITGLAYWPLASVFMFRCNVVNAHYYASVAASMLSSTTRLTIARRFVSLPHRATAGAVFGALWNMCVALRRVLDFPASHCAHIPVAPRQ